MSEKPKDNVKPTINYVKVEDIREDIANEISDVTTFIKRQKTFIKRIISLIITCIGNFKNLFARYNKNTNTAGHNTKIQRKENK